MTDDSSAPDDSAQRQAEFVAEHRSAWLGAGLSGAAIAVVSLLAYTRYTSARRENSLICGTFSECTAPEGGLLMWLLLASLVVPAVVLLSLRVRRAWLILLPSPVVAVLIWWTLASRQASASVTVGYDGEIIEVTGEAIGLIGGLIFIGVLASVYVLLELFVGYGYSAAIRLTAAGALVAAFVFSTGIA